LVLKQLLKNRKTAEGKDGKAKNTTTKVKQGKPPLERGVVLVALSFIPFLGKQRRSVAGRLPSLDSRSSRE
jgi:hypothetical protein